MIFTVKWFLRYLQKQPASNNECVKTMMKVVDYCIVCFERFVKILNKNAYIIMALFGRNFCVSAKHALQLMVRNALRIGVLAGIGSFLQTIGIVFITVVTAAIGYGCVTAAFGEELNNWIVVTVLYGVIGYVFAKFFMLLFGLSVDAVFLCFLQDEEMRKASKKDGAEENAEEDCTPPVLKTLF